MDAWTTNLCASVGTLVLAFVVTASMERLVDAGRIPPEFSRKVIHIIAGSWVLFWPLFDDSHWTKYLNILVPGTFGTILAIKGLTGSPDDRNVKTMSRTGDRKELLLGPFFFSIVMLIAGTFFYKTVAGVLMMAAVGWGDGIAPYVGKHWPFGYYKTFGRRKTLSGSFAFLVGSAVAGMMMWLVVIGSPTNWFDLLVPVVITTVVATVVEAFSPSDVDNWLIPGAVVAVLFFLDTAHLGL